MARVTASHSHVPARSAVRALARAAVDLVGGAVADIVHEMLMQSMLATDVASMLTGAMTSVVARLFRPARPVAMPVRDGARRCPNESA